MPQPPPQQPSSQGPSSSSGGGLGGKIAGGVFGAIFAIAIGGAVIAQNFLGIEIPIVGQFIGGKGSGKSGGYDPEKEFKTFGVEMTAADPDALIQIAGKKAVKWSKDAKFYSVNLLGFKPDGTIDFTEGGSVATIEYFSPAAVGSTNLEIRKKSIRKFIFNSAGVKEETWGVKDPVQNVPGTPVPTCTSKQMAKVFEGKGAKGKARVHVSLDPGFSFATNSLSYHAMASDPKLNVWLDIGSCKIIKEL